MVNELNERKKVEPACGGFLYFDCVKTPMTSAYKSAMMCTLPVLGPQYLQVNKGEELVNSGERVGQSKRKKKKLQPSMC